MSCIDVYLLQLAQVHWTEFDRTSIGLFEVIWSIHQALEVDAVVNSKRVNEFMHTDFHGATKKLGGKKNERKSKI